jgi:N,N'-diacetyllegionaminate synthase
MTEEIRINNRPIGEGQLCYVIAEAGVNHNGSLDLAHQLVQSARQAGADCVKFQTFRADRLLSGRAPKANYQLRTTNPGESQNEMLRKLEMPDSWHFELATACRQQGVDFLSTPYSFEDVDFLDSMDVAAFKLASIHCAEPAFVQYVASKRRPMILATGMATLGEVDAAVRAAREAGNEQVVLLQCTTDYPSRPQDANLRAMQLMNRAFGLPVGYSDHTETPTACIASIALGACMIEKHFTLDRSMPGPDHAASFDPAQFGLLVKAIREAESVLGSGLKEPCDAERQNMKTMRRSLAARRDLAEGDILDRDAIALMRPASGLKPALLPELLGLRLRRPVKAGQLLSIEDFNGER